MATQVSERQPKNVEIVEAKPVMSLSEAQALEKRQSQEHDYYAVYLKDEVMGDPVRVRTVAYVLDEERNPVLDENGKKQRRNAHDVALNVWAAYGCDDYTLEFVMLGARVVATPRSILNELEMAKTGQSNQTDQAA